MAWLAIVVGVVIGLAIVWRVATSAALCRYVEHDYEGATDSGGISWRCRRCGAGYRAGRA
jgi:hypothetical protein